MADLENSGREVEEENDNPVVEDVGIVKLKEISVTSGEEDEGSLLNITTPEDDMCAAIEIPIEDSIGHKDWSETLKNPGRPLPSHEAAPACELFYLGVSPTYFGPRHTCDIYGTIMLYDEDDTPYELWSRNPYHPQTITPQDNLLSLHVPIDCLVSVPWSHVSYYLKDKADNDHVVVNKLHFDKPTDINQYHKLRQPRDDNVFLSYAFFPTAVVAVIEITLVKRNDSGPPTPLHLSGKIITCYGNTYGDKYPRTVLLNTPTNQPIQAMSNSPIKLSRNAVVVPAYSFLRFDIHLSQPHLTQQEEIICQADFLATSLHTERRLYETKDFDVYLEVKWCHPYQLDKTEMGTTPGVHDIIRRPPSMPNEAYPLNLVEVYAVRIHHNLETELKICGQIKLCDDSTTLTLFDRGDQDPVQVSGHWNNIPIYVSQCFKMHESLRMQLDLSDVEGQVMIDGNSSWDKYYVLDPIHWFNKRICTVIRGVGGYAAVFYTIFSEGASQAEVTILFMCNEHPNDIHRLVGSVVARRSDERYLTEHDRAHYQSVLFQGETSDLKSGDELVLMKSKVVVPTGAFLIVAFDLRACPLSGEFPEEDFTLDVPFNTVPHTHVVERTNYSIQVSVAWSVNKIISEEKDIIPKLSTEIAEVKREKSELEAKVKLLETNMVEVVMKSDESDKLIGESMQKTVDREIKIKNFADVKEFIQRIAAELEKLVSELKDELERSEFIGKAVEMIAKRARELENELPRLQHDFITNKNDLSEANREIPKLGTQIAELKRVKSELKLLEAKMVQLVTKSAESDKVTGEFTQKTVAHVKEYNGGVSNSEEGWKRVKENFLLIGAVSAGVVFSCLISLKKINI